MKVLVVDDEAGIREVIKEYCLFEHYDVLEAENGVEALNILQNDSIDIIVLDIMMPKMDGYSTLREIRKNYQIPVIMLSARSEEYNKLLSFELGVDDYVTKPFSPKELKLTPKEYELLVLFVENKSIALSRETLLSKVWGYDFFGDDRTIDTHIKNLRNNLGPYRDMIVTLRGVGYKFETK